ncbi:MAG: carboxypeptidase-like regulatory domain-containing protein [Bacteroidales bacterium]|nr:carboxypeptidase-like regulatory domain-containing protein [Candidatus Colimorpha pelethequi]
MKRLNILFVLIFSCFSVSAQQNDPWQIVIDSCRNGSYSEVYPLARSLFEKSLKNGDSQELLRSSVYLCGVDYCFRESPMDSAVYRLNAIMPLLKPVERDVARALLVREYQYFCHYGYGNNEIQSTDNPDSDYKYWGAKRCQDTIDALVDRILSDKEMLRSVAPERFAYVFDTVSFSNDGYAVREFTPTLYEMLLASVLEDVKQIAGETFGVDFKELLALEHAESRMIWLLGEWARGVERVGVESCLGFEVYRWGYLYRKAVSRYTENLSCVRALEREVRWFDSLGVESENLAVLYSLLADMWSNMGFPDSSMRCCNEVVARWKGTEMAGQCTQLLQEICKPWAKLYVETAPCSNASVPALVEYRNLDSLYFFRYWARKMNDSVLRTEPLQQWSVALPKHDDVHNHSALVPIPPIPQGRWFIVLSTTPNPLDGIWGYTLQESYDVLMLFSDTVVKGGYIVNGNVIVVDRMSGEPLEGVPVTNSYSVSPGKGAGSHLTATTDHRGVAFIDVTRIPNDSHTDCVFTTYKDYQCRKERNRIWYTPHDDGEVSGSVVIDRPIYRQGDTVHFAFVTARFWGFLKSKPLKSKKYLVRLYRSRDEVLDSLWIVTDEWGEADGSFIIPSSAKSGEYSMEIIPKYALEEDDYSWDEWTRAHFSVEPLRQPHFKIELSLADTLVYFDRPFTIKGRAIGYNGMPVADAEVRFASESLKLDEWSDTNKIKTDSLGNFSISLGPVKNNGSDYQSVVVNVWVTDPSGETHQDLFSFGIKEKPVKLQFVKENQLYSQSFQYPTLQFNIWPVRCTDSRGIPLRMDLGCRLSRLRKPDILLPSPFSHKRSYEQSLSQEEFSKLFPNYAYDPKCGDYTLWEVDSVVYDLSLATDSNGRLQLPVPENLPSGVYKIEVDHPLSDGLEDFIVYHQPHETKPQTPDMLYCEASPSFVEVGDSIRLRLSTPLPQLRVVMEVSENNINDLEHSEIQWITLSNEVKEFSFPVNERMLGKTIGIKVYAIQNLASFSRAFSFIVQPHHQLKLDISTFRDHIQSGRQQRWTLGVKDEQDRGQSARMILTMFDKSLYESPSSYESHCPYCYQTLFPDSFDLIYIDPFRCDENSYSDWRVNVSAQTPSRNRLSFNLPTPNYFTLALLQNIIPVSLKDGVWCSNSNLHGVITDQKTGEPLPFVNIVLKQDGLTIIGTQTDFDGIYSFRNLPVGSYEMEIAYIGYAKMICKVQIGKDGSSLAFNQQLQPTATNLDEVVIVAYAPIIEFGDAESIMHMTIDDVAMLFGSRFSDSQTNNLHLRQNLSSLAFFRPDIVSNRKGKATLEFTAPDRLTEWDIFGVAWTKDMKIGSFNFSTVTSNPLMVQPLVPRFLRQGDTIDFAVKVSNASDSLREAQMTIELQGRVGEKDSLFFLQSQSGLKLEANASQTLKFRIPVPKDLQTARYKVTAQSPDANDGEQDYIPVLPNKELVTQSLAIYLNGKGEKHFTLTAPNSQFSIVNSQFTLTPNPLWLALASMPYLQELKNPSTLYLANTLAADLMSQSILKTYPQLREKLAAVIAQPSTPSNSIQQINKSTNQQLFSNPEAIETRIDENLDKLVNSHNPDGGWSWMPEQGESSVYVTRSILETLHIPINNSTNQQLNSSTVCNALRYIDGQMEMLHRDTLAPQLNNSTTQQLNIIEYLYLRSIYPFNDTLSHPAFHDWYAQIKQDLQPLSTQQINNSTNKHSLRTSARLAQIFYLNGDTAIAQELVRRLKQRSLLSDEMGMYWRDNLGGCYYYQRPIETQALLIETFALITPQDTESVALMQQWLLKQKQTTHWGSDMATLAAIKALLIPSALNSQLNNSTTRQLNNPSTTLKAGPYTLVAKDSFAPVTQSFDHFTPDMGEITLSKSEPGIVWGAAYIQYFAPLDSIPYNEMGIKLKKELYIVQPDGSLRMAKQFKVGDKVRVRILIDCDRTLEYLELKDQRSGAFEPCSTRSGWEWNDGLRYYVSVENSSTSCYIDRLNKGQYLVEYDLWVNASGSFTEGIATMQCLYAPEFRSNTPGSRIQVIEN